MRHRYICLALLVLASSCAEPDEGELRAAIEEDEDGPSYPNGDTGASVCKTVTVTGKVFYNDLRYQGRFPLRFSPTNAEGVRDPYVVGGANENYLGLLDGQIDVYEIDNTSVVTDPDCAATQWLGSTTVAADGAWSWTGSVCDACNIDFEGTDDEDLSIAAKVSLRKCDHPGARCVSLRDPDGAPQTGTAHYANGWDGTVWSRWIRNASNTTPKVLHVGTSVATGTDYFQASSSQTAGVVTDVAAQAASVFATLVDVTRKMHLDENVPFDNSRWGEIKVFFPDVLAGSHSHQASRLCIEGPGATQAAPRTFTTWTRGWDAAHEYGHLVHYWQWEGVGKYVDLCYQETQPSSGYCGENDTGGEYALNSFKEGWADFIGKVTFEDTGSSNWATCDDPAYTPFGGRHFKQDVAHGLCNLRGLGGGIEIPMFASSVANSGLSLNEMTESLADVWWGTTQTNRNEVTGSTSFIPGVHTPLGICEFAQRLVDAGASATDVEATLALTSVVCDL